MPIPELMPPEDERPSSDPDPPDDELSRLLQDVPDPGADSPADTSTAGGDGASPSDELARTLSRLPGPEDPVRPPTEEPQVQEAQSRLERGGTPASPEAVSTGAAAETDLADTPAGAPLGGDPSQSDVVGEAPPEEDARPPEETAYESALKYLTAPVRGAANMTASIIEGSSAIPAPAQRGGAALERAAQEGAARTQTERLQDISENQRRRIRETLEGESTEAEIAEAVRRYAERRLPDVSPQERDTFVMRTLEGLGSVAPFFASAAAGPLSLPVGGTIGIAASEGELIQEGRRRRQAMDRIFEGRTRRRAENLIRRAQEPVSADVSREQLAERAVGRQQARGGPVDTEAERIGATAGEVQGSTPMGAVAGALEILPVQSALTRAVPAPLRRKALEVAIGGLEEASQESAGTVLRNLGARTYDPERDPLRGVRTAAETGAGVGTLMNAITTLAGGRTRGPGATVGPSLQERIQAAARGEYARSDPEGQSDPAAIEDQVLAATDQELMQMYERATEQAAQSPSDPAQSDVDPTEVGIILGEMQRREQEQRAAGEGPGTAPAEETAAGETTAEADVRTQTPGALPETEQGPAPTRPEDELASLVDEMPDPAQEGADVEGAETEQGTEAPTADRTQDVREEDQDLSTVAPEELSRLEEQARSAGDTQTMEAAQQEMARRVEQGELAPDMGRREQTRPEEQVDEAVTEAEQRRQQAEQEEEAARQELQSVLEEASEQELAALREEAENEAVRQAVEAEAQRRQDQGTLFPEEETASPEQETAETGSLFEEGEGRSVSEAVTRAVERVQQAEAGLDAAREIEQRRRERAPERRRQQREAQQDLESTPETDVQPEPDEGPDRAGRDEPVSAERDVESAPVEAEDGVRARAETESAERPGPEQIRAEVDETYAQGGSRGEQISRREAERVGRARQRLSRSDLDTASFEQSVQAATRDVARRRYDEERELERADPDRRRDAEARLRRLERQTRDVERADRARQALEEADEAPADLRQELEQQAQAVAQEQSAEATFEARRRLEDTIRRVEEQTGREIQDQGDLRMERVGRYGVDPRGGQDGQSIEITNLETGRTIDGRSRRYTQVLGEYFADQGRQLEESRGRAAEEATTPGGERLRLDQYLDVVARESRNPLEIAEAAATARESEGISAVNDQDNLVAEVLDGPRITPQSFDEVSDPNFRVDDPQLGLNWLSREGRSLDEYAQELSERTGRDVEPQDVVDIMLEHPRRRRVREAEEIGDLRERFRDVTGVQLTDRLIDDILSAAYPQDPSTDATGQRGSDDQPVRTGEQPGRGAGLDAEESAPFQRRRRRQQSDREGGRPDTEQGRTAPDDAAGRARRDRTGERTAADRGRAEPGDTRADDDLSARGRDRDQRRPSDRQTEAEREVREAAAETADAYDLPRVPVVPDPQALPEQVRIVYEFWQNEIGEGFEQPALTSPEGQVYLIADGLERVAEQADQSLREIAQQAYMHEVVAHQGFAGLLGEQRVPLQADVYDALGREPFEERGLFDAYADQLERDGGELTQGSKARLVEELAADLAENADLNPSLWQRLVETMQRAWARVTGQEVTEADLKMLLRASADHLRTSPNPLTGVQVQDGQVQFQRRPHRPIDPEQVQSESFKNWFGDWESNPDEASVVTNEDGTPRTVYHATPASFNQFARERGGENTGLQAFGAGFYFGQTPQFVDQFGSAYSEGRPNMMPVYLNIRNPFEIEGPTDTIEMAQELGVDPPMSQSGDSEAFTDALQEAGYDGVIYRNGKQTEYVAFEPEQVKSASGNRGTFDPSEADVRFSRERTEGDPQEEGDGERPPDEDEVVRRFNEMLEEGRQDVDQTGRPELANPASDEDVRSTVDVVDEARKADESGEFEGRPDPESFEQWREEADRMLEEDYDAVKERLFRGDMEGPVDVMAAKEIINREGLEALDEASDEALSNFARMVNAYREQRTDAARELAAGRDPEKTPAERRKEWLMESIFMPSGQAAENLSNAETEAERQRVLESHNEQVVHIRDALRQAGLSPAQLVEEGGVRDRQRMAQAIRLASSAKASPRDKFFEYWRNSILSAMTTQGVNFIGNTAHAGWDFTIQRFVEASINEVVPEGIFGSRNEAARLAEIPRAWRQLLGDEATIEREQTLAETSELNDLTDVVDDRGPEGEDQAAFMKGALLPTVERAWQRAKLAFDLEAPVLENALEAEGREKATDTKVQGRESFEVAIGSGGRFVDALNDRLEEMGAGRPLDAGRTIRVPGRLLNAADQMQKSIFHSMQIAAEAYRMAKAEGLEGQELTDRVNEMVSDPYSEASMKALEKAQGLAFQSDLGPISDKLLQLRNTKGFLGALFEYKVPFLYAPANILKKGIRASPLGSANLLWRMMGHGLYETGVTDDASFKYRRSDFTQHAAEQVIAWSAFYTLKNLVLEDDEEDEPVLTGSAPSFQEQGKYEFYRERGPQPNSVKIGDTYYNYRRIEPLGTQLALTVDIVNELEDAEKGQDWRETMGQIMTGFIKVAKDNPFVQGLGDIYRAIQYPASAGNIVKNVGTGFVPNLIHKGVETTDDVRRDYEVRGSSGREYVTDFLKTMGQEALPLEAYAPPPTVDLWGRPLERYEGMSPFTDFLYENTLPLWRRNVDRTTDLDRLILNFNEQNQNPPPPYEDGFWPAKPSDRFSFRGRDVQMTKEEYHDFLRRSGQRSRERLMRMDLNVEEPTIKDLEKIETVLRYTRRQVKYEMITNDQFENFPEEVRPDPQEDASIDDVSTSDITVGNPGQQDTREEPEGSRANNSDGPSRRRGDDVLTEVQG